MWGLSDLVSVLAWPAAGHLQGYCHLPDGCGDGSGGELGIFSKAFKKSRAIVIALVACASCHQQTLTLSILPYNSSDLLQTSHTCSPS